MADVPATRPRQVEGRSRPSFRDLVSATEIDLRLFGMVVALVAILVGFELAEPERLLTPDNLVTLSLQTAPVAIISTGMVLVIVSRNIDLSVGSIVGVVSMAYALLMTKVLPEYLPIGHPLIWVVTLILGILLGGLIGAVQGFIIAYIGVPSFVVTLGGLLIFRGLTFVLSEGASVSGLDPTFNLLGGSATGALGATISWLVGLALCLGLVALVVYNRRRRKAFGFPVRPQWAEALVAVAGCAVTLFLIWIVNNNFWPPGLATRYATEHGIAEPAGGLRIATGIPWPLMIVLLVTIVMTFIARRVRFGRYIYAIGGNPDAAELAGINTRRTIMKSFIVIGVLCAVSAAIAAARLQSATLDVGSDYELYVIAAAVIGGTSFAGGIGTIPGAVLGALVMQALNFGLSQLEIDSPVRNMVAGLVLIVAVAFDAWARRRSS
jgi:D-xylose transport system permease protein